MINLFSKKNFNIINFHYKILNIIILIYPLLIDLNNIILFPIKIKKQIKLI